MLHRRRAEERGRFHLTSFLYFASVIWNRRRVFASSAFALFATCAFTEQRRFQLPN